VVDERNPAIALDPSYLDSPTLAWLETVSDLIYKEYAKPSSNNNNSLHECYLDLGSFGTAVEYQEWNAKEQCIRFRVYPLADCWILENSEGKVDTVHRKCLMTTRQIEQKWPNHGSKKILECKEPDRMWEVIHAVFPRSDRDTSKLTNTSKPFASFYFCKEAQAIFSKSGFDELPFAVPRWLKRAGEVYGRSPAMNCLPDIRLVNAMERVQLKSLQKIVDPPLMLPDDGFMMPIRTAPSSLIFYDSTMNPNQMIQPLETKGRVDVGEEKLEQKRQHIMRAFYADWITRMKKRERQTATEVMDEREEMLQMMSPILGRLQSELLGPRLERTYRILLRQDLIPPAPPSLESRTLMIEYVSPAAKAQVARKGINIRRFTEELLPLAQVDPSIMDAIHPDRYVEQMAIIQDVSRKVLRTPEELEEIRAQRSEQQQAATMAAVAEPASNALKNVATAREKGLV
jgi:hypothetical protein